MATYQQPTGERVETEQNGSPWIRRGAAAAILGGALGVVLSPLMSAAYRRTPDGDATVSPPWEPGLVEFAAPLLTFADPVGVYTTYGMVAVAVFLGLLAGILGYLASHRSETTAESSRLEAWGFRVALAGLVLSILGNVADYWLGRPEFLDFLGFLVGTLGGLLVLAAGLAMLGYDAWRRRTLSRGIAALFLLWLPLAVGVMALGLDNIPGGALLPLGLVSIALGSELLGSAR